VTRRGNRLAKSFPGTPESVGDIRNAIAQLAQSGGFHEEKVEAIRLAVSEAATNAVLHAYSDHSGTITVSAEIEAGGVLRVLIADEGRGMLPHRESDGLGLGLPIITTMADHVDITSPIGKPGTEVHMRFRPG
jgi:anti-sigma regulatory factor (Ser/Thr protein kinase)